MRGADTTARHHATPRGSRQLWVLVTFVCLAPAGAAERTTVSISSDGRQAAQHDQQICNFRTLDASGLGDDALVAELTSASEPVLVRNAMSQWTGASLSHLVAEHGETILTVVRGAQLTNDVSARDKPSYRLSLAEYSRILGAGDVPPTDYVFSTMSNTSVAPGLPDISDLFAKVSCGLDKNFCLARRGARGTLHLAFGGDGTFNGLHRHGNALSQRSPWGRRRDPPDGRRRTAPPPPVPEPARGVDHRPSPQCPTRVGQRCPSTSPVRARW